MKAKRVLSLLLALTLSLTLSPLTLPAAAAEPVAGMGNLSRNGTYRRGLQGRPRQRLVRRERRRHL